MPALNMFDGILIVVVLLSAIIGVVRGFVREALSLLFWVAAGWVSWNYGPDLANQLTGMSGNAGVRLWAARVALFIGVVMTGAVITWLVGRMIRKTAISGSDRVIGMLFGLARGVIIIAAVIWALRAAGLDREPWWRESKLLPYAAPAADALEELARRRSSGVRVPGLDP